MASRFAASWQIRWGQVLNRARIRKRNEWCAIQDLTPTDLRV